MKSTFRGIYSATKFLMRGHILKKDIGARFATKKEMNQIANSSNKGVLIDGVNKRLSDKDSFRHVAIISPPGGGKTTGYIVPNILDKARSKCSMLITDPSGEIYANTSKYLKNKGFNIITLDPSNINSSSRFNPFDGLDHNDTIEIERICASIILSKYGSDKEQIWNDGAISLLEIFAKCLAYTKPEYLSIPNLNYLIQVFGSDGGNLDDWVADHSMNPSDPHDRTIIDSWLGLITSNANMLNTYTTIVKTALKQFNNRQIQKLFHTNDIDLIEFRKKKTAIYIILPENQAAYFQFLVDVFYSQFFSSMMKNIPSRKILDVYCFLDEFGSSYIDNFSMIINNVRKYRVSLSMVFQGISQISEKYGEQRAKSIKAGISTTLIFAGADFLSAKEQSDRLGQKVTLQRKKFEEIEETYSKIELMSADKIRTLENNQFLFVSANYHPFVVTYKPFYQSGSPFKGTVKKGAYQLPPNTSNKTIYQLSL
jgi:type IV secretory pathway TraG/TraD family ATPase VirD4